MDDSSKYLIAVAVIGTAMAVVPSLTSDERVEYLDEEMTIGVVINSQNHGPAVNGVRLIMHPHTILDFPLNIST